MRIRATPSKHRTCRANIYCKRGGHMKLVRLLVIVFGVYVVLGLTLDAAIG
jgi:hypothetical protein